MKLCKNRSWFCSKVCTRTRPTRKPTNFNFREENLRHSVHHQVDSAYIYVYKLRARTRVMEWGRLFTRYRRDVARKLQDRGRFFITTGARAHERSPPWHYYYSTSSSRHGIRRTTLKFLGSLEVPRWDGASELSDVYNKAERRKRRK